MQEWNTTGWFNHNTGTDDIGVTAVPSDTTVITPVEAPSDYIYYPRNSPVNNLLSQYFAVKNKVYDYMTDLHKAPQQSLNAWNKASLGERTNAVLGTVGTLLNAYNTYKYNKLAKEQLNHAKEVYHTNLTNQRKMTNSKLEDRQKRRVEEAQANGRTTTSVSDYMAKYGV